MGLLDSTLATEWLGSTRNGVESAGCAVAFDDEADRQELDDYRVMLEATTSVTILLIEPGGLIRRINPAVERMLGFQARDLIDRPISMLHLASEIDPDGHRSWPARYLDAEDNRIWTFLRKDGTPILVALHVTPVLRGSKHRPSHDDGPTAYVVTVTDVTAAVTRALDLRRDSNLSADVVDHAPALVVVCRNDGTVVRFNDACARFTGRPAREVVGFPVWDILSASDDDEARDKWNRLIARATPTSRLETLVPDATGVPHVIRLRVRRVPGRDGTPEHVVIVGHDVTADREGEDLLRREAQTDSLTGLVNRPGLAAKLQHLAPGGANRSIAHLLYADLDDFKLVNDAHGHPIGDIVLAEIGSRLRATVRQGDVVARFGGDEFVMFCPGLGAEGAAELRARLRRAVLAPIQTVNGPVRVTVSIGAVPVAPGDDWRALLAIADRHMYDQKREGRASAPA